MSKWMSGPDAMNQLDRRMRRLRNRLNDAIDTAEGIDGRLAEIQTQRVGTLQRLADIRLDAIAEGEIETLDQLHQKAKELLTSHSEYVERERASIEQASNDISQLEAARADLSDQQQQIEEDIESTLAEVESKLKNQKAYTQQVEAFEAAEAIADRAKEKLAVAIQEREEKSEAYRSDPLFSYLWDRGFGTTAYKVGGVFRMLDHWVARLCKYDDARPNFARLNDLTDWLGDHEEATQKASEAAQAALERLEQEAIERAGVQALETKAASLRDQITETDAQIDSAEARHTELSEQHAKTLLGDEGPAKQARRLLEGSLQRMKIPDLRLLAAETVSFDDDEIVDDLVALRTEEMSLELEAERIAAAPKRLSEELESFEELRRRVKSARLDSQNARVRTTSFDDALESLAAGRSSASAAFRQIQRSVRRKESKTRHGFGGRQRGSDIELDDVVETVAAIAIESAVRGMIGMGGKRRGSFGGFPTKGRGSSRRRSGGFRTGGGF